MLFLIHFCRQLLQVITCDGFHVGVIVPFSLLHMRRLQWSLSLLCLAVCPMSKLLNWLAGGTHLSHGDLCMSLLGVLLWVAVGICHRQLDGQADLQDPHPTFTHWFIGVTGNHLPVPSTYCRFSNALDRAEGWHALIWMGTMTVTLAGGCVLNMAAAVLSDLSPLWRTSFTPLPHELCTVVLLSTRDNPSGCIWALSVVQIFFMGFNTVCQNVSAMLSLFDTLSFSVCSTHVQRGNLRQCHHISQLVSTVTILVYLGAMKHRGYIEETAKLSCSTSKRQKFESCVIHCNSYRNCLIYQVS